VVDPLIRRGLIGLALLVGAAPVALVVLLAIYGKGYVVPASSMEPTLHCARPGVGCEATSKDHVLALRFRWPLRGPRRGDVVAFRTPARAAATCGLAGTYRKRVIALPGERFAERAGVVLIDGRPLREPYVQLKDDQTTPAVTVPAASYALLGDARSRSCDSRAFGPVKRSDLIARVVALYWPPGRIGIR
jgi:signal peptidase I